LISVSSPFAVEPSLGLEARSLQQACSLFKAAGVDEDHEFQVVIPVSAEDLEAEAGWLEGEGCDASLRRGLLLRLDPPASWQQAGDPYAAVQPWLDRLEAFLQARPDLARAVQLGSRPDRDFDPPTYAFLVEKVSTLMRSIDTKSVLVLGAVGDGAETWVDALDTARLAPYVQGLSMEEPVELQGWSERLAQRFPGLPIWLHAGTSAPDPEGWLQRLRQARALGVRCVTAQAEPGTALADAVVGLARALPARLVLDAGPSGLQTVGGGALVELLDPLGPERMAVLPAGPARRVALGPGPVSQTQVLDLVTGEPVPVKSVHPEGTRGPLWIDVPDVGSLLLVRYVPSREPHGETETVGVTTETEPTAEEILAGLRAFEAAQQRALRHYRATAILSYHYRAEALNESIDVRSVNRFYWKDRVGEYEETELFVNGARWRGPAPSLPFIAAQKVKEVPLEIRLDQSYRYTLKGRADVHGEPAWELAFEPVQEGTLYSGTIWVHRDTFARLRLRLVQHEVKEPITSNMDDIEYAPVEHPGGPPLWLPVKAYRQMVFTVLGRTVAVERRVQYEDFAINTAEFEQVRQQAYASGQPILREDSQGFATGVRQADGTWKTQVESPRNVAFFGGMSASSGGVGTPFAGLNYFDFNWRGTGTQVDIAFAGVLLDVAWTDPSLGGTSWELTAEGRATAYPDRFKKTDHEGRRREEDLEVLEQGLMLSIAHPVSSFAKAELRVDASFDNYSAGDDTDPAFVLPPTRPVLVETARWRQHQKGWGFETWFSAGQRFGWQDWGLPGSALPGAAGLAEDDRFQRWGLTVLKAFYPSRRGKLSIGATAQAGRDLDRFSRFRIGDFRNARVRGYNSDDITYDRGVTGQITWLTTVPGTPVSVESSLEGAVIENDDDFQGRAWLSGGGLAVSWNGPWGTLLSARTGFALGSDLDLGSGGLSLRLLIIKTYDRWPWQRGDGSHAGKEAPLPR
jgi:hypothetical protein